MNNLLKIFIFILLAANVYAQNFWQQTNGPTGDGSSQRLAQAPNGDLYATAGNGGAIYKSTNGGERWVRLSLNLPDYIMYQCSAIFAASNGYIYVSGGKKSTPVYTGEQYIFRSTDNGSTWENLIETQRGRVVDFIEMSNGYIFAARKWEMTGNGRGGIYRSTNNGLNWTYTNAPTEPDGIVGVGCDDNGFVYAVLGQGSGRIMRSTNYGDTWINDLSTDARDVIVTKSNRNVFISRQNGMLKSTNFGVNWTNVGAAFFTSAFDIWLDTAENIYTYTGGGLIFRSTDNGTTWTNLLITLPPGYNHLFPLNSPTIFACVNNNFMYKSTDMGQSWVKKDNGVVATQITALTATINSSVFAIKAGGGLYRSTNNGNDWSLLDSTVQGGTLNIDSSGNIFLISGGSILRSSDNGNTWEPFGNGISGGISFFTAGHDRNLYVNATGLFKSTNNGTNWFSFDVPPANVTSLAVNSQGHIYTQNGTAICKTTNGGTNWQTITPGFNMQNFISINNVNGDIYVSNTVNNFYKSTDGGLNWNVMSGAGTDVPLNLLVSPNGVLAAISMRGNFGSYYNISTNFGANWLPAQSGWLWETYPIVSVMGPNGHIYQSTTRFYTDQPEYLGVWRNVTSLNSVSISGQVVYEDNNQPVTSGYVKALKYSNGDVITVDSAAIQSNGSYVLINIPQDSVDIMAFQDDEEALIAGFVPTYYSSTIHWQQSTTLYPTGNLNGINIAVYRITGSNDDKHIGGGVYTTNNFSSVGIRNAIVYAKIGNDFKGYSISNNTGLYQIDSLPQGNYQVICDRMGYISQTRNEMLGNTNLDSVNFYLNGYIIGIQNQGTEIPEKFNFYQNYPNPFNPVTTIRFDIPKKIFVKLKIFDMLGREVASLSNQELEAGSYSVMWNASMFASGVYFYRLETDEWAETKKLVLIK